MGAAWCERSSQLRRRHGGATTTHPTAPPLFTRALRRPTPRRRPRTASTQMSSTRPWCAWMRRHSAPVARGPSSKMCTVPAEVPTARNLVCTAAHVTSAPVGSPASLAQRPYVNSGSSSISPSRLLLLLLVAGALAMVGGLFTGGRGATEPRRGGAGCSAYASATHPMRRRQRPDRWRAKCALGQPGVGVALAPDALQPRGPCGAAAPQRGARRSARGR